MKIHWPLTWKETDGDLSRVWVPREHAEAEVEKARREGVEQGKRYDTDEIREARADERERIADMLEREMNAPDSKDHDAEWNRVTRNALRYAVTCIRNRSVRQEGTCDDYWKHIAGTCDCGCVDRHFVSSKGICQCSCHGMQEPKPLEDLPKLGPGLIISTQDSESDKVIAMKVNDIIRHIKTMRSDLNYLMGIKA